MKPKPFEIIMEFIPQSTKTGITYEAHKKGSLIRCKDCKHRIMFPSEHVYKCLYSYFVMPEHYCGYAEPKDTTEEVRKQLKDMEQRREMDRKK